MGDLRKKKSSLKFRGIFRPKSEIQIVFPAEDRWSPKKKRSSSPKFHEIRCQSTKIAKVPLANTNLGLDLHFSSPKPVNFFEEQSSLGGGTIFVWGGTSSHLGGHGPRLPPVALGLWLTHDVMMIIQSTLDITNFSGPQEKFVVSKVCQKP